MSDSPPALPPHELPPHELPTDPGPPAPVATLPPPPDLWLITVPLWTHTVIHTLLTLGGLSLAWVFDGMQQGPDFGDRTDLGVLLCAAAVFAAFAAASAAVLWGISRRRRWAHTATVALAALLLVQPPISTVMGLMMLIGASRPHLRAWLRA